MFISILFTVALLLTIILPVIGYFVGEQTKGRFKRTVIGNVVAFFGVFLLGTVFIFTSTANAAVADTATISSGLGLIAAGLAIGLSCIGSGYFGKALIFVALAEGIALWGFIVAFLILTHVA